jgi:hypothetical protein
MRVKSVLNQVLNGVKWMLQKIELIISTSHIIKNKVHMCMTDRDILDLWYS